jgi:hypothetical protein
MKHATKHVQKRWQLWAKQVLHSTFCFFSKLVDWIWLVSEWMKKWLGFLGTHKPSWVSIVFLSANTKYATIIVTSVVVTISCSFRDLFSLFFTHGHVGMVCALTLDLDPDILHLDQLHIPKFAIISVFAICPVRSFFWSLLILWTSWSSHFIFPFHHGQEKEFDLGITPNQLSIRNCEDG